jgi:methionyl-tRNA formyltransferase
LSLLPDALERVAHGDPGDPQPTEVATEAPPFGTDYARIDWSMPALSIHTQVRAWTFNPGTHSVIGPVAEVQGRRILVTKTSLDPPAPGGAAVVKVECGDGPIWVLETKPIDEPA